MNSRKQTRQRIIYTLLSIITLGTVIIGCTTAHVPSATTSPTALLAKNIPTMPPQPTATIPSPTATPSPSSTPTPTSMPTLLANPNKRALWVWNEEVVTDNDTRKRFLDFIQSKRINAIYLHAYDLPSTHTTALEDFIANVGDAEVELLVGDSSWALSPHHSIVLNFVQEAVTFTQDADPISQPTGLHFDIEPYLLDEWENDQQGTITQYLDLLVAIRAKLNETQSPLFLSADIPFWYDTIDATYNGTTKPLHQHVQDIVDYIVIMDYRDSAKGNDGIIVHAQNELHYANQTQKLVTIGVETNCIEPTKITFCEEGEAVMEQELHEAKLSFEASLAFHGFAIHDYVGYVALSQAPPSILSTTSPSSPTITPTPSPAPPPTATVIPTSPPSLGDCPSADADGTIAPAIAIYAITFIVNGVEQVVDDDTSLQATTNDQVQVKEVIICLAEPLKGNGGSVYVEFDPVNQNGQVVASEVQGTQAVRVLSSFTTISEENILWTLGDWRHISVVTVHYPGSKTQNLHCESGSCEIDDRMIVSIK